MGEGVGVEIGVFLKMWVSIGVDLLVGARFRAQECIELKILLELPNPRPLKGRAVKF